jgi:hypothetical protein
MLDAHFPKGLPHVVKYGLGGLVLENAVYDLWEPIVYLP